MTESSLALDQQSKRYPLSFTQEWFVTLDQGDDAGAFGRRFILVCPIRITGQWISRCCRARSTTWSPGTSCSAPWWSATPTRRISMVRPPCPVPLEVRDLPPVTGKSRDMVAQELIVEAAGGHDERAGSAAAAGLLCRFDDRDSVLFVTVHHSVSDAWSVQIIMRDLGAFYAARRSGIPAKLPTVRQYREYSEWQRAHAAAAAEDGAPKYWAEKLHGAREFTMPNDHGHPESYSRPVLDVRLCHRGRRHSRGLRPCHGYPQHRVHGHALGLLRPRSQITGDTDLAIRAFTAGRNEVQFQDTMGLFLNVVPFRTNLATARASAISCTHQGNLIDAMAHELPVNVIEQTFPEFIKSREDTRMSQFIISDFCRSSAIPLIPIAEGAREVNERLLQEPVHHDIPSGMVWNLYMDPSGDLYGSVLFNLDEFDESTVAGWAADLPRILTGAVGEPDRDWKLL